jgi:hypothetical protein
MNTLVWNENAALDNADPLAADQSGVEGDSVSHAVSAGLRHSFTRDLSSSVGYTFTTIDRDQASDVQSHAVLGDLAYVISPRTSTLVSAFGTLIDRRQGATDIRTDETDSRIFGVRFGVRRQLTTFLAAFVSVGPTLVERDGRPTRVFANWQASLDGTVPITRRTSLSLSTQQNIRLGFGQLSY